MYLLVCVFVSGRALWLFPYDFSRNVKVSATDLSNINCYCRFKFREMQINDVQPDEGICEKCSINEVKISVSNLCKNKRICSSPHTDDASSCLFHPRYARIHYSCQGNVCVIWINKFMDAYNCK